jgi:predicted transposase YbfD/YdcC
LAADGKELCGVGAHGGSLCLVSLTCHGSGVVLGQVAVDTKSNEIPAMPRLLAGRDLTRCVLTVDALHCQKALAEQVLAQGGHYLMSVKGNQPTLHEAVERLFATPAGRRFQPAQDRFVSVEKGHGRLEQRVLESSTLLNNYLDWPGVAQVLRRTCHRTLLKRGQVGQETTYFITSLPPEEANAEALAGLLRGHWTIENKVHHVRDATMREDACTVRTGTAAQALAALRNGVLNVLRGKAVRSVAQALRLNAAQTANALRCVGAIGT